MNDYGQYDVYDNLDREATNDGPLFLDDDVDHAEEKVDFDDPAIASLPRVMLMGPRRAGKTSIQRVVFQKMSPHETLFRLEATQGLERALVDHTPLCRFVVHDFPGDYYEPSDFEGGRTSLIFVVDAQDEPYDHVLQSLTSTVTAALQVNPNTAIEVFINKVDGELFLSDESKYDCRRDVMTQVTDELAEAGVSPDSISIRYHLTSIYDHSIYEALSRVVQRLIPQLPTLENLLNVMVSTCSMEKAYLFDVVSKLYISTDTGPADMQSVELCSDMIDVVLDVSGIYGLGPSHEAIRAAANAAKGKDKSESSAVAADTLTSEVPAGDLEEEIVDQDSAYDNESASVIRLSNGMVLYLKEVDTMLALVCITRSENFRRKGLINYNIGCLKRALQALVQPEMDLSSGGLVRRVAE
ncbi:Ras-related GTP-binding protein C/D [Fistulifera solaris]|uniref:Ras-related GTP-binding protein C/D n=1 Tax=Fistulifera solaris TaxID=1519565 RepID=A0A1Z5K1B2_FISSO|nr:Ras-related GTP-binding protein C/D [Fistulifera solaris]|eukprot:GAX19932.1 Ras-related GTP-binding protein C/D [Fistulifera solaris]